MLSRLIQILTSPQSLPDFRTPFIVDDTFDPVDFAGEPFASQFQEALEAKPGQLFPMPGYGGAAQAGLMSESIQPQTQCFSILTKSQSSNLLPWRTLYSTGVIRRLLMIITLFSNLEMFKMPTST